MAMVVVLTVRAGRRVGALARAPECQGQCQRDDRGDHVDPPCRIARGGCRATPARGSTYAAHEPAHARARGQSSTRATVTRTVSSGIPFRSDAPDGTIHLSG